MPSEGLGLTPADTGVAGRDGPLGDGRGRDAELSLASKDFISRADGLFDSEIKSGFNGERESGAWEPTRRAERRLSLAKLLSDALGDFGSLVRRDFEVGLATVFDLVGFVEEAFAVGFGVSLPSEESSVMGWGFRACATARGPAHLGIIGKATLARTKLESTATGKTFSLILWCRALSASPNTMCCTLL